MFAHLHCRSWFSFLSGASSPEELAKRAAARGAGGLALTDRDGVYGAVRHQKACKAAGIRSSIGAEVGVEGNYLVLLAASQKGYASLCRLLTMAHIRSRDRPDATMDELAECADDLFCLTGTDEGRLWKLLDSRRPSQAAAWVGQLRDIFGARLSVEAAHHLRKGDTQRVHRLARLSRQTQTPLVATGDVQYAAPADYRVFDALNCVRLGITIFDHYDGRPPNAEAFLRSERVLRQLIPYPSAFSRAAEIADACHVDLLPEMITPPGAKLPPGQSAKKHLRSLCYEGLSKRYSFEKRSAAAAQLEKELAVIFDLELEEYFLVVWEVVREARRRGIRCGGRGSAANSIVCYLLEITSVDPLRYNLLFERFLHGARKGTPDIDVDFDSERRDEIIAWMEERFSLANTAMTATLQTYRLRSGLRDIAKALGWPIETVNRLGKAVPHRSASHVREHADLIIENLGQSRLSEALMDIVEQLDGCPRHLSLHVGGMVLSRRPLNNFTPVQRSANGVAVVQFDKDDIERLGLVKLDVLSLRMLATISECVEIIHRHEDPSFDLDAVPLDDVRTFNLIRRSDTLGCFQVESQGQLHLLGRIQPETFEDLIIEIALFRPGPIQGNLVDPYVERRTGREEVTYDHPDLRPILQGTRGILLFQEQVLQVAHEFAGMSLAEADEFRRLMSSFRNKDQMEAMRSKFVDGAVGRGVSEQLAHKVFDNVAYFVGFGFTKSHAAAFAQAVYLSCYLKCHHPAAFMASVMQHRPGMYDLLTLEQDAKRRGVRILPPAINASGIRYDLERYEKGRFAIQKPLTSVRKLSPEDARAITLERLRAPFSSVTDLYERVALDEDVFRYLARAGALDGVAGESRKALWEVGLLKCRHGRAGSRKPANLFQAPLVEAADLPNLPELTNSERLSWDQETQGAAREHPVTLVRRMLNDWEVRAIQSCYRFGRTVRLSSKGPPPILTVAGRVSLRQAPPTAKGTVFVTIEDETASIQCIVWPDVLERYDSELRNSALIVRGHLMTDGNWRGLQVLDVWPLDNTLGGYQGHPNCMGGRDTQVISSEAAGFALLTPRDTILEYGAAAVGIGTHEKVHFFGSSQANVVGSSVTEDV